MRDLAAADAVAYEASILPDICAVVIEAAARGLPPVPRDIVFRLAELALEQSRGTPAQRIAPLLLGRESKAGDVAAAAGDVAAASAPPNAG